MPGTTNVLEAATTITVWEDDPANGRLTNADKPDIARQPFGYDFRCVEPPTSNQTGTPAFRYWNAAETLRRGADFWAPSVPMRPGEATKRWQRGPVLEVRLDRWEYLQAEYTGNSLNFYYKTLPGLTVYTGASRDTLCHELGHAILDAIKPDLWESGMTEVAAFHEAFGDMSAILCALQLPSLRTAILTETLGQLYCNSRLSRVAEQFGTALHDEDDRVADADCLRNAWNSFTYCDPAGLPASALTTSLSASPHSFSRIFSGALFEAFCLFLDHHAADSTAPTADELLDVSRLTRDIMARGALDSSVQTGYFAEVASRMVLASALIDPDPQYPAILLDTFVRRAILSGATAATLQSPQARANAGANTGIEQQAELVTVSVSAAEFGLNEPLLVETVTATSRSIARSGTFDGRSIEPASPEAAAAAFLAQLFADGQIDPGDVRIRGENNARMPENRTHVLRRDKDGLRLRRQLFQ